MIFLREPEKNNRQRTPVCVSALCLLKVRRRAVPELKEMESKGDSAENMEGNLNLCSACHCHMYWLSVLAQEQADIAKQILKVMQVLKGSLFPLGVTVDGS